MEKVDNKVGIFILNHNGIRWLKENLYTVNKYSKAHRIVIIDNNSTDDSIEYIEANFPNIKIKKHQYNYGFSKGYNRVLMKEFDLEYFILMNNDVTVTPNWIEPMLELIQQKDVGIIQPKIINSIKQNQFDYAGAAGGFIDILGLPFCRGRIINNLELDFGQYDENINIFWASGCCFLIKRKLFQRLKGFDEDLFMHQEEIDLCWRTHGLKKKIYYCGSSLIYHYGGGTLNNQNPKKHYYNHRNNLLILIKNMPTHLLIATLPMRLLLDYCIILSYLILGLLYLLYTAPLHLNTSYKANSTYGYKMIKKSFWIVLSHISFLLLLKKFLKKRYPIIDTKQMYLRSIIWDYYILKKKKFSDLKKF